MHASLVQTVYGCQLVPMLTNKPKLLLFDKKLPFATTSRRGYYLYHKAKKCLSSEELVE